MNPKNLDVRDSFPKLVRRAGYLGAALVLLASSTACGPKSIKERNEDGFDYNGDSASASYLAITNDSISSLPSTTEVLTINSCNYVTSLDRLPEQCPQLKRLTIKNCSAITDLSFIYRLYSLEYLELNDMVGIDDILISYLESRGIEYKITGDDIEASKKAKEVLDRIIEDDMTDEEKIKAITIYVSKQCKYRITKAIKSNEDPLSLTLLEGKGVCAGIAYTTNVLLRSAGIDSYEIVSGLHGWNVINLDGKYYYLDVTNLGGAMLPRGLARLILKVFGLDWGYMTDPSRTALTVMEKYDNRSAVVIPESLVEDILNGENEKNIFEKYSSSIPLQIIVFIIAFLGISKGFTALKDAIDDAKYRRRH